MNPHNLNGTAVVTGAGQGIGRAIALQLLQAGCHVIAIGRTAEKLETLAIEAGVDATHIECHGLDIRDTTAFAKALKNSAFAPVKYLVNGAGVLTASRIHQTPADEIADTIAINFTATLQITQIIATQMIETGGGSIVTIGSNSATAPRAGLGAYPASKAAITQAMKCLALDLAPHNIRCNIVAPGSTDTPMQHSYQTTPEALEKVLKGDLENWRLGIPMGRMADPNDVAELTLFLLSDRARHITMENIVLDGGATLGMR